nr:uncharacterized protein LOC109164081 [Ipomoea trifida]GMC97204.1 Plant self-incompatibility S1 [Ipomoea batatas]GLL44090.1 uncharacterized protein LOC109164081 [Ipomoea trifida]GMD05938.1 Plant self-incompatibility S1 [Ipomoea batatas]GMD82661.1 Plant self-incompatibility S1 [Ipomoea batatas]
MAAKFVFTLSILSFLFRRLSAAETYVSDNNLKSKLFPNVEITLANDYDRTIYFMCKNTDKDNTLHPLDAGQTYRFNFTQVAFPMKWCFLYINSHSFGFLWVYNMRSRCTKCFWSITNYPNLYRTDRVRWERQKLFMPPTFEIDNFLLPENNTPWG